MILVIDNYDSFTYNLVHLVERVTKVHVVVRNDEITLEEIGVLDPSGILISPGPGRPEDAGISEEAIRAFGGSTPILGVCLGHQAIAQVFGGTIVEAPDLMHGKTSVIAHDEMTIFNGVAQRFKATRYHSLVVDPASIPDCLEVSATSSDLVMGLRHRTQPIEGVQFHPESILSDFGATLVENWVRTTQTQPAA